MSLDENEMRALAERWWIELGDDVEVAPSLLSLLTSVAASARAEALEDAAKECDAAEEVNRFNGAYSRASSAHDCATFIRHLVAKDHPHD